MSSSSNLIRNLLQRMKDGIDKDSRYMGTIDLCSELEKGLKLTSIQEQEVCNAVLDRLDDAAHDVQTVAVRCLGVLSKRVGDPQVAEIVGRLGKLSLTGKADLRDIYSISLRSLIDEVNPRMGRALCGKLIKMASSSSSAYDNENMIDLIYGIRKSRVEDIGNKSLDRKDIEADINCTEESLETMTKLLVRFGKDIHPKDQARILEVLLHQLLHPKDSIRKRIVACLGALAIVIQDDLFSELMTSIFDILGNSTGKAESSSKMTNGNNTTTIIQVIGTISRRVGHKLENYIDTILPLLLQYAKEPEEDEDQTEEQIIIIESCLGALAALVAHCPQQINTHLSIILSKAKYFLVYDPNYIYQEENDSNMMNDVEIEEDDDDEDGEDYGYDDDDDSDDYYDDDDVEDDDDGDTSYQLRLGALKLINAILDSFQNQAGSLYVNLGVELLARFKEREELVKVEVINCYKNLLHIVKELRGKEGNSFNKRGRSLSSGEEMDSKNSNENEMEIITNENNNILSKSNTTSAFQVTHLIVSSQLEKIVIESFKVLVTDKNKSKIAILSMLKVLMDLLTFQPSFSSLLQLVCLNGETMSLKENKNQLKDIFESSINNPGQFGSILKICGKRNVSGCLYDTDPTLKLYTLEFIRTYLTIPINESTETNLRGIDICNESKVLSTDILTFTLRHILTCIERKNDEWYKIVSEALKILSIIMNLLIISTENSPSAILIPFGDFFNDIYQVIHPRLVTMDMDTEVKEFVIAVAGLLVASCRFDDIKSDDVKEKSSILLNIIIEKCKNEVTRDTVLRVLKTVAMKNKDSDLFSYVDSSAQNIIVDIPHYLSQQARTTKTTTLECLSALVMTHLPDELLEKILILASKAMINDQDLVLAAMSLDLVSSILSLPLSTNLVDQDSTHRKIYSIFASESMQFLIDLLASPVLQDKTLTHIILCFHAFLNLNNKLDNQFDVLGLIDKLLEILSKTDTDTANEQGRRFITSRRVVTNVAKCIGDICHTTEGNPKVSDYLDGIFTNLATIYPRKQEDIDMNLVSTSNNDLPPQIQKQIDFFIIGEVGTKKDLSTKFPNIHDIFLAEIKNDTGELDCKFAASYALGAITCGNINLHLPTLLNALEDTLEENQKKMSLGNDDNAETSLPRENSSSSSIFSNDAEQFLLLSLKQVIATFTTNDFFPKILDILMRLLPWANEDIIRYTVYECLGMMANIETDTVINSLKKDSENISIHFSHISMVLVLKCATISNHSFTLVSKQQYTGGNYATSFPSINGSPYNSKTKGTLFTYLFSNQDILVELITYGTSKMQETIDNESLAYSKALLQFLNILFHHQPAILLSLMEEYVKPFLLSCAGFTLPKVVNLGPFSKTIDHGLPIRKLAFTCILTLLDALPSCGYLSVTPALPLILQFLSSKNADEDFQTLHSILIKLCQYAPNYIESNVDTIIDKLLENIQKGFKKQNEQDGGKSQSTNETNDNEGIIKSAMRVIFALSRLESASSNQKLMSVIKEVIAHEDLANVWSQVVSDKTLLME